MALTKAQRDALPDGDFAVPGKRLIPIHDDVHVRMARGAILQARGLSDDERAQALHLTMERAKTLNIDTSDWNIQAISLDAMSLVVPDVKDHPNKMPFSGVLTRIDEPSDLPLGGSAGRRVILTKKAAEDALPSLLGMAVDLKDSFDGHDPKKKVGIITEAHIEGNAIHIEGFIYAADFPQEAGRIQAEKARLGFSYEVQAQIESMDAPTWVITSCKFTGAAILYKDKAAYQSTSLKAQAETEAMNEQLKAIMEKLDAMGNEIAEVKTAQTELSKKTTLDANGVLAMVKPHADKLRENAASLEAAGIGIATEGGQVAVLRAMADRMEAEAKTGKVPSIFVVANAGAKGDDTAVKALGDKLVAIEGSIVAVTTLVKDMEKARLAAAAAPERKTVTIPAGTKALLAKAGLNIEGGEKVTVEKLDQILDAAKLSSAKRLEVKYNLAAAGLMEAA